MDWFTVPLKETHMTEKCLITGASGFMGRWLRSALGESGFEVRCFDSQPAGVEDEILGDILDTYALEKACTGVHAVCHLVALQSAREYSWEDFYAVNVMGTEALLKACIRQNVRHVLFFSTELVYGHQTALCVAEDSALNPCGFYGRSKMMAEELCRKYTEKGLQLTIVRPCNIMGPGKRRVVDQLFDRIRNNAFVPLVGGKHKPCQFIDVRDIAEITAQILKSKLLGVYNVGSPHPPSTFQVYSNLIKHAHSHSKLVSVPAGLFRTGFRLLDVLKLSPLTADQYYRLTDSWIVDTSKLYDRLQYSLQYDEVQSITDTYDAYCTPRHQPASAL
jgi:nucleoside-diphosphate-sugar epimerase